MEVNFLLGANELTVGSNNLSTVVSGAISDGGVGGGTGGSLIKVGTGTLTLSGANTYTGPTTVNGDGVLDVTGSIVSSSLTIVGSGASLVGTGAVGNLQINSGGTFAPGLGTPGTFMTVSGNSHSSPARPIWCSQPECGLLCHRQRHSDADWCCCERAIRAWKLPNQAIHDPSIGRN